MINPFAHRFSLRRLFFAALAILCVLTSCAALSPRAARAEETDSQFWTLLSVTKRYKSGLRLYGEIQPRVGNHFQDLTQILVRPAVGYQVSPTVSLWLGYAWTPSFYPRDVDEHRIFPQVTVENRYAGFEMINRTRLEIRFIENVSEPATRLRHQLRFYKPLGAQKRWGVAVADELFVQLNSTPNGPQAGFDQNRPYIGIARQVNEHARVEAGYQGTTVNRPNNRPSRRLDTLLLTASYNF